MGQGRKKKCVGSLHKEKQLVCTQYCKDKKHYHGLFYDNPEIIERRMNENIWFEINQPLLFWLSNTDYGRDLLYIPKHYSKIVFIRKNCVRAKIAPTQFISDFRVGAKWANVIRYRWKDFCKARDWYYDRFDQTYLLSFKYKSQPLLVATTTTAYPNPDPETTTVDGFVYTDSGPGTETWAGVRALAGAAADDSSSTMYHGFLQSGTLSTNFDQAGRSFALFDTSGIDDGDTISAATLSYYGTAVSTAYGSSPSYGIILTAPASNTAIAASDFANVTLTRQNSSDLAIGSWSTVAYNDFTLSATGISNISKTGVTKFGCTTNKDIDDSTPAGSSSAASDSVQSNAADQVGTTNDPKLVVTHAAAATTPAGSMLMMGVGV